MLKTNQCSNIVHLNHLSVMPVTDQFALLNFFVSSICALQTLNRCGWTYFLCDCSGRRLLWLLGLLFLLCTDSDGRHHQLRERAREKTCRYRQVVVAEAAQSSAAAAVHVPCQPAAFFSYMSSVSAESANHWASSLRHQLHTVRCTTLSKQSGTWSLPGTVQSAAPVFAA